MTTRTKHSTIWYFAEMMKAPGTMAELCARFGVKQASFCRTLQLLRKYGLIYVRSWQHIPDSPTQKWAAVWDTQTTPFELPNAPRPAPKYHSKKRLRLAADA